MTNSTEENKFRSGFVAIIGRPNVGKSTLLNTILGEKVAIVSNRPQTTRNRIRGVKTTETEQVVFIDTPGVHRTDKPMNEFMVREALSAISEVDAVIYMVDATRRTGEEERYIMENLDSVKIPVMLVINKIDELGRDEILPVIDGLTKGGNVEKFHSVHPISAKDGDGVEGLLSEVTKLLPEGPMFFPPDMVTDQQERFLVSEIIREKIFNIMLKEVPYSTAVEIERYKEDEEKGIIKIHAAIIVERDSQKGIII